MDAPSVMVSMVESALLGATSRKYPRLDWQTWSERLAPPAGKVNGLRDLQAGHALLGSGQCLQESDRPERQPSAVPVTDTSKNLVHPA